MRPIDGDAIAPKLEGKFNQDMVRYAPTLDYKDLVPQGEWIRDNSTMVHCTVCKVTRNAFWKTNGNPWNFCPNCGARMKGAD